MKVKKRVFAVATALIVGFITAVGMCLQILFAPSPVAAFDGGGMRIVVDAGHGGVDGGVVGIKTGVKESDLNLEISFRLRDVLTDMGFEVTMTRKTEAGLYDSATKGFKKRDMQRRKEIIEKTSPALVLSVHQNYYPAGGARGGQVFYKATEEGERLALAIQSRFNALYAEKGVKNRVAKTGEYFMLECAPCPSVIVECGFLSSAEDEALLCDEAWQKKMAESIAAGVLEYFAGNAA